MWEGWLTVLGSQWGQYEDATSVRFFGRRHQEGEESSMEKYTRDGPVELRRRQDRAGQGRASAWCRFAAVRELPSGGGFDEGAAPVGEGEGTGELVAEAARGSGRVADRGAETRFDRLHMAAGTVSQDGRPGEGCEIT